MPRAAALIAAAALSCVLACADAQDDRPLVPDHAQWQGNLYVRCETTAGDFTLELHRSWAPHGYDRFAELLKKNFFDGQLFYRALKSFVVQFGVAPDPKTQAATMGKPIPDDAFGRVAFRKGVLSFAGNGKNSRDTHMFLSAQNAETRLVGGLGTNPEASHETPIGYLFNPAEREAFFDTPAGVNYEHGDLSGLQAEYVAKGAGVFEEAGLKGLSAIRQCRAVTLSEARRYDAQATAAAAKRMREESEAKEAAARRAEEALLAEEAKEAGILSRIQRILQKYNHGQLKKMPKMLKAWEGKEGELLRKLETKYKVGRDDEL